LPEGLWGIPEEVLKTLPGYDPDVHKNRVWETERKLAEDGARPIIFYNRFAYCWQPPVKGWTMMVNSIINNWRMEDVWLDR
jgi:peptide/nickel transport system substrate-binding protein